MQETVKQGRQSIDLLKDTITKMDSSLSLDIQDLAIRIQQKELDTKNLKISKEKSRPKMVILSPTVSVSDSVFLYYNIENRGESDAEDFILSVTPRILNSGKRRDTTSTWIYSKVFKGKTIVARAFIYPTFHTDFISKIYISYSWPEFQEIYKDSTFYYHTYKGKGNFSTHLMDKEELKKIRILASYSFFSLN